MKAPSFLTLKPGSADSQVLNATTKKWLYLSTVIFVAITGISIYLEFYYFLLLPLVMVVLWAAFFKLDVLILFVTMCTPLSINLEEMKIGGIGMYLPTEPILVGILLLFLFNLVAGKSLDAKIYKHPVSLVIGLYLVWMTLTCVTSEMPIVSLKFLATRLWFIVSMYYIAAYIFRDPKKIRLYFLLYLIPLFIVIIYTITRHWQHGFDKDSSHWVMEPLFKDHTSYGAVLAMYVPILIGILITKNVNLLLRIFLVIGCIILCAGLILSYTRAAWISVVAAAALLGIMILAIKLRHLIFSIVLIGSLVVFNWEEIELTFGQNTQESSDKLGEHVGSISNVSSDASNLERLNRWSCAWEMFKERPIVGWGPGTYQFVYAPFQTSKDRTIISTNQGDGGNAHSEYLGPLCEQGVFGFILSLALVLSVSSLSFRLFHTIKDRELKILVASAYLGLMTYFIHGILNNYLDTDKASIPFWGFIAVLVAVDIYHNPNTISKQMDLDK